MIQQNAFNFSWINFQTSDGDHVFDAVDDVEVSRFVDASDVARMKPTVDDGGCCVLGAIPVAQHYIGPSNGNFPKLSYINWQFCFAVYDLHLDIVDWGTDRTGHEFQPVIVAGKRRRFSQTVTRVNRHLVRFPPSRFDSHWHRGGSGETVIYRS